MSKTTIQFKLTNWTSRVQQTCLSRRSLFLHKSRQIYLSMKFILFYLPITSYHGAVIHNHHSIICRCSASHCSANCCSVHHCIAVDVQLGVLLAVPVPCVFLYRDVPKRQFTMKLWGTMIISGSYQNTTRKLPELLPERHQKTTWW